MKLHYERIWDAEIPDDMIIKAIDNYCDNKFFHNVRFCERYFLINRKDIQLIAESIINNCTPYKGDYPNAFSKPLRERIKDIIHERREE